MPAPSAAPRGVAALVTLILVAAASAGQTPPAGSGNPSFDPSAGPLAIGGPDVDVFGPFRALPANEDTTLLILVGNDGPGDVTDVEVRVSPDATSGLLLVGFDNVRRVGPIVENDTVGIVLNVATPPNPGGARLFVTLSYRDDGGRPFTVTREVAVRIGPEEAGALEVELLTPEVGAGQEQTLRFQLRNRARNEWIRDLDVNVLTAETSSGLLGAGPSSGGGGLLTGAGFTSAFALLEGGDLVRGGSIPPGGVATASMTVRVARHAPDVAPFSVAVTYGEDGFARAEIFDFALSVGGAVQFRVLDLREEPRAGSGVGAAAGSEGVQLRGVVVNTGSGTAFSPQVRVPEGGRYASTSWILIEDLEPNEPVTFRIPVSPAGDGSAGNVSFAVQWNDEFGIVRETTVSDAPTPLPPREEPTLVETWSTRAQEAPLLAGLLGAALVIAALMAARKGVGVWRRRRDEAEEG